MLDVQWHKILVLLVITMGCGCHQSNGILHSSHTNWNQLSWKTATGVEEFISPWYLNQSKEFSHQCPSHQRGPAMEGTMAMPNDKYCPLYFPFFWKLSLSHRPTVSLSFGNRPLIQFVGWLACCLLGKLLQKCWWGIIPVHSWFNLN